MASLQVRKLPEPLHRKLVEMAQQSHRSIPQQAIVLLAEGLKVSLSYKQKRQEVLATIKTDAKRLKKFDVSDPVELIRQDRL
ncbi:MAG: hypothetical protein JXM69_19310 [Anaerolineae bacterium]|nr:hypothetical protein [Anaerolineae bacterium]